MNTELTFLSEKVLAGGGDVPAHLRASKSARTDFQNAVRCGISLSLSTGTGQFPFAAWRLAYSGATRTRFRAEVVLLNNRGAIRLLTGRGQLADDTAVGSRHVETT